MQKSQRKHWTWDDYVKLPEDGKRYEVLDGELVVMAGCSTAHQYALGRLHLLLNGWVEAGAGGLVFFAPIDVVLAYDVILQPDVIWVPPYRQSKIVGHHITGIPDLVVEVLSPSTAHRDVTRKAEIYARYGASEYWVLDPIAQTLEMLALERRELVRHAFGSGSDRLLSRLEPELVVVPGSLCRTFPAVPPEPDDRAPTDVRSRAPRSPRPPRSRPRRDR